jgi:hypothetical protein
VGGKLAILADKFLDFMLGPAIEYILFQTAIVVYIVPNIKEI